VPTAEQCKAYAAECHRLGQVADISPRRERALMTISRSWTGLATQLDRLATIIKEEGK
jgi:hypothetical protein